jgi:hypothetical protein
MKTQANNHACLWCGRPFSARRGGSPKRFCSASHRMAFWSALRRWAERAVAAGILTIDHIRNGDPAACTLLPGSISSVQGTAPTVQGTEAQDTAPASTADSADEASELLDDLLATLLIDLPNMWDDLASAIPDKLYDRIGQYIERCLQES